MGIFNLTDLRFNTIANIPLDDSFSNNLSSQGYNVRKYPIDVGSYDKGHYMVIHINEQVKTQFSGGRPLNSTLPTIIKDRNEGRGSNAASDLANKLGSGIGEIIDRLPTSIRDLTPNGNLGGFVGGIDSTFKDANAASFVRTIRRTTDSIALYMPDTLNFDLNQNYSANPLTGGAFMSLATIGSVADALKSGGNVESIANNLGQNLGPFGARIVADRLISIIGNENLVDASFAALTGMVANPVLEVLYSSPEFRKFSFEFLFYPRSEREAVEVQDIINLLKFHQSPELNTRNGDSGFFLIPPSEFDIKFYYMGNENPNIPKISTCVLENINVDYAPNGFAAYETNSNTPSVGGTGMPVGIRLRLTFAETEIMTKQFYAESVGKPLPGTT